LWKITAKFLAVIFFALGILRRAGMVLARSDKRILRLFALDGFCGGKISGACAGLRFDFCKFL